MGKAIAVVNQKGGVGKTMISLNLAAALHGLGARTLVVDLDPQGYATIGAGLEVYYNREGAEVVTLATALMNELDEQTLKSMVVPTSEGFSMLPSHFRMFMIEPQLAGERGRELRLRRVLQAFDGDYDVILIDCPPSMGILTDNGIIAAGRVLVPMLPDGHSLRAFELLDDQIRSIREELGVEVTYEGIVLNQWTDTNAAKRVGEDLAIATEAGGPPVLGRVRRRVAATNTWEEHRTVVSAEPLSPMAKVFGEIAQLLAPKLLSSDTVTLNS